MGGQMVVMKGNQLNNEIDSVLFNETISDLASLIQEHGASTVANVFADSFPEQANALQHYLSKPNKQVAALFKP